MRISTLEGDPHYNEAAMWTTIKVDGAIVRGVVTADTVLNEIVVSDGTDIYGNVKYKTVKGNKVEIIPGPYAEIKGGRLQKAPS